MLKVYLIIIFIGYTAFGQQTGILPENSATEIMADSTKSRRWDVAVDVVSRYIWRGQSWGGAFIAVQPSVNVALTEKLHLGTWATTNFQKEDYFADGEAPKGYQEVDFGISYQLLDYLSVQVWDYYWPSIQKAEGTDTGYFNYGPDGVKTVDASLVFDFSEGYKLAFDATISTLVAGNDYRYNSNGDDPEQNYTTYIEAGYTFKDVLDAVSAKTLKHINLRPVLGAVLNNQAEYYTYADYNRPSFVNLGVTIAREFQIGKKITMPLTIAYTHNAATANTELLGKDFVTLEISFWY